MWLINISQNANNKFCAFASVYIANIVKTRTKREVGKNAKKQHGNKNNK